MRRVLKFSVAIIGYVVLIGVVDMIMGVGIPDSWDNLMKWVRK